MDIHNKHKLVTVAFIPDYIVNTLAIKGISLADIDGYVGNIGVAKFNDPTIYWSMSKEELTNIAKLNDWFLKNMSTNDIYDLIAANEIMDKHTLNDSNLNWRNDNTFSMGTYGYLTRQLMEAVGWRMDNTPYNELVRHYSDNKVDTTSIILSRSSDTDSTVWSTVVTENTLFVVLHPGFTNFIVYNDLKFREYFITRLIDCLFTSFGEDAVVNNRMFKSFIRL